MRRRFKIFVVPALLFVARAAAAQSAGICRQIDGVVVDATGAAIPSARIMLDAGKVESQTAADATGAFAFRNAEEGEFTLTVEAEGFADKSYDGTCGANGTHTATITMSVAGATTSVDAITEEQFGKLEIHEEEQQRLVGVIPNFYVAYDWNAPPMTVKQKFALDGRTLIDPVNLAIVAINAGVSEATGEFSGFGGGPGGYFRRYGAGMGDFIIGATLSGAVFPTVFRQDPRYFYMGPKRGSVKKRLGYALMTSVVCRGDNRRWQPCYSNVAGELTSSAISNAYYPDTSRGVGLTFAQLGISLASDSVGNVIQEFVLRHFTGKAHRNGVNNGADDK